MVAVSRSWSEARERLRSKRSASFSIPVRPVRGPARNRGAPSGARFPRRPKGRAETSGRTHGRAGGKLFAVRRLPEHRTRGLHAQSGFLEPGAGVPALVADAYRGGTRKGFFRGCQPFRTEGVCRCRCHISSGALEAPRLCRFLRRFPHIPRFRNLSEWSEHGRRRGRALPRSGMARPGRA